MNTGTTQAWLYGWWLNRIRFWLISNPSDAWRYHWNRYDTDLTIKQTISYLMTHKTVLQEWFDIWRWHRICSTSIRFWFIRQRFDLWFIDSFQLMPYKVMHWSKLTDHYNPEGRLVRAAAETSFPQRQHWVLLALSSIAGFSALVLLFTIARETQPPHLPTARKCSVSGREPRHLPQVILSGWITI